MSSLSNHFACPKRSPERAIAAAVMFSAFNDAGIIRERANGRKGAVRCTRQEHVDALIWIFIEQAGGVLSFQNCCETMDLDHQRCMNRAWEMLSSEDRKFVVEARLRMLSLAVESSA